MAVMTFAPGHRVAHAIPVSSTVSVHGLMETSPLEPTADESLIAMDGGMLGWGLVSVSSLIELWASLVPSAGAAGFQFSLGDGLAAGGALGLSNDAMIVALSQTNPLQGINLSLLRARLLRVLALLTAIENQLQAAGGGGGGGSPTPTPEPASILLFGLGLGIVGYTVRRRRVALA